MRIVDRKTFLALPPGTVFATWDPCVFGDLCILTGVIEGCLGGGPIDFRYTSIVDSLGDQPIGAEYAFDTPIDVLLALDAGSEVPTDFGNESRDGLFDLEQRYAIWDRSDVWRLIARLKLALQGA